MRCPFCSHDNTHVVDSRVSDVEVRRRRECSSCHERFTTYETAELELCVIKKDGRREPFTIEKIHNGIVHACNKRPITTEQISVSIRKIEQKVRRLGKEEIKSSVIGTIVMKELLKLDKIAYLRFASVCKAFDDPKLFEKEIELLKD